MSRSYSREEAEEIFRRAAARSAGSGEPTLTREELVDAARQAGLDPDAVHAAAEEVSAGLEPVVDPVVAWRARKKRAFTTHFLVYAVICLALLAINLMVGGPLWFQWTAIGWGIAIALQAIGTFRAPAPEQIERIRAKHQKKQLARQKMLEKERRKLEAVQREADRERAKASKRGDRERREAVAAQFEAAVEEGVAALMQAATRTIHEVTRKPAAAAPAPKRETDFDRFVARQKSQRVPLRVEVDEPQRIEHAPEDELEEPAREQRRRRR